MIIKALFAIYIALLLVNIFPFSAPLSAIALFAIFAIIVFLLLSQSKVFKKAKRFSSREMLLAILIIGLLLTIVLSFTKIGLFGKLPSQVQQIFVSQYSLFAWLTAPLLILALIKKKGKDKD